MVWTDGDSIAVDLRRRLRRLVPALAWEISYVDHPCEQVGLMGRFCLNGQPCNIMVTLGHEAFPNDAASDKLIRWSIADVIGRKVTGG